MDDISINVRQALDAYRKAHVEKNWTEMEPAYDRLLDAIIAEKKEAVRVAKYEANQRALRSVASSWREALTGQASPEAGITGSPFDQFYELTESLRLKKEESKQLESDLIQWLEERNLRREARKNGKETNGRVD